MRERKRQRERWREKEKGKYIRQIDILRDVSQKD